MYIRTLSKEDTKHLVNLSCIVVAWGVSGFYFDSSASNKAVASLGDALLSPYYFIHYVAHSCLNFAFNANQTNVFIILWLSYLLLSFRLSKLLIVKNHEEDELRSWYFTRKSTG